MNKNETTEGWLQREVTCNVCKDVQSVLIDPYRWESYTAGRRAIQNVWPEKTAAYREQIIGLRSGYHVCDSCWPKDY